MKNSIRHEAVLGTGSHSLIWTERWTLNKRVVGSNPAKARRGICEQDTLISTARGSHKQNCLRHPPNLSKKPPFWRQVSQWGLQIAIMPLCFRQPPINRALIVLHLETSALGRD
jgi:hypothetical protein